MGEGNVGVPDETQKLTEEVLEAHVKFCKFGMKALNLLEIVVVNVLMQGESVRVGSG